MCPGVKSIQYRTLTNLTLIMETRFIVLRLLRCSPWGLGEINMNKILIFIQLSLLPFALVGCKENVVGPNYNAVVSSAVAVNCKESCHYLNYELTVKNNSLISYCLPGELYNQNASNYVYLYDSKNKLIYRQVHSDYVNDPYGNGLSADVQGSRSRPQLIIQPHTQIRINSNLIDEFNFPPGTYYMNLRLEIYPCDLWAYDRYGFQHIDLKAPVVIR